MTLNEAAKAYKGNEELLKHFRLVWKHFGGPKNQVTVKSVLVNDFESPAKPTKLKESLAKQQNLFD